MDDSTARGVLFLGFLGLMIAMFLMHSITYVSSWLYHLWTANLVHRWMLHRISYVLVALPLYASLLDVRPSHLPPLDLSTDSLRLARILPGRGAIRIEIETYTFLAAPRYDALSYTWGQDDPVDERYILVNGKPTAVGSNLYLALRRNRQNSEDEMLWIDALCINQTNIQEKNHQIPLMAFIFSRAWQVRVWLGQVDGVGRADVRAVQRLLQHTARPHANDGRWRDNTWWIHDIVFAEYWKRAWVVQEIVAARSVLVQFGDHNLDWQFVRLLSEVYSTEFRELFDISIPGTRVIQAVDDLRSSGQKAFRLDTLLEIFQDSMCRDPRDKVYSLLGIADGVYDGAVVVDYAQPVREIYADVLRFLDRTYGTESSTRIQIMRTASLIRRLLNRSTTLRSSIDLRPSRTKSETAAEAHCRESRNSAAFCQWVVLRSIPSELIAEFRDTVARGRLAARGQKTLCWEGTGIEWFHEWRHDGAVSEQPHSFTVRGRVLDYLLPSNVADIDVAARADGENLWTQFLDQHFPKDWPPRNLLIRQSARLMTLLGAKDRWHKLMDISNTRLDVRFRTSANVLAVLYPGRSNHPYRREDSWWSAGQLAVGSATGLVAIVPTDTRPYDLICQFYGTRGSAIVRRLKNGQYKIVGRSGVLHEAMATELNWDMSLDAQFFSRNDSTSLLLDLEMDLSMLTALSLNSMSLDGTIM